MVLQAELEKVTTIAAASAAAPRAKETGEGRH
jgi:hypothetical protein